MSEHTPEPWAVFMSNDDEKLLGVGSAETGEGITDHRGGIWNWDDTQGRANARRIVACVNACKGIPTEELEKGTRLFLDAKSWLEAAEEDEDA